MQKYGIMRIEFLVYTLNLYSAYTNKIHLSFKGIRNVIVLEYILIKSG